MSSMATMAEIEGNYPAALAAWNAAFPSCTMAQLGEHLQRIGEALKADAWSMAAWTNRA